MIKFQPSLKTLERKNFPNSMNPKTVASKLVKSKVDLSGEEQGYYKVDGRFVKMIFPR